jgi:hypothetical protein
MIFSGNNNLSLNHQTGLSFSIDLKFNNSSGYCELGFSGLNPSAIPKEKVSYIFDKSKLYDPESRLIYFYKNDQSINLSGSINPISYSYYIDGNLLCLNGKKQPFNLNKFYLNTSGCTVDADLKILGDVPNYNISLNKFNVSGLLTGTINNNSLSQFKIYSGVVTAPTGFSVNSINLDVLTGNIPSFIIINTLNATKNQINDGTVYPITLNLYTNFGLISRIYNATGNFIKDLQVILNLNQGFDFDTINSISGINDIKNQEYNLNFYIKSGSNNNLPKNLSLNLEYFGGKTGLLYQDILGTGIQNITLTGLITGSGILSKTVSMAATGYDFLANSEKTGYITGIAQNIFFATGFNSTSGFLPSTGFFNGNLIYKNIPFNKSGYSIDGINDYSNSFINDYNYYENKVLTGFNPSSNFLFGSNIASNSNHSILAISAYSGNIGNYTGAGLVYIFTGNNNWIQTTILSGSDANTGDNFGYSLSMNNDGNILAVGSPNKNLGTGINTYTGAGAVYIFNRNGTNWIESAIITGSGSNPGDKFGHSLELSQNGTVLIVGSPNKNIGSGINTYTGAGMAHLFSFESNIWNPLVQISGASALSRDGFGHSVSLSSDGYTVAVGATGRDVGSYANLGSIYLFKADQFNFPSWDYNSRLTGSNSLAEDNLGYSVKVNTDGTTILASSINNTSKAGHVYVFTGDMFNSVAYRQSQRLRPLDLSPGDNFGHSLTINNNSNLLCISSPYNSYSSLISGGSCYVFEKNNSFWIEKQKITGNLNYTQNYNKFGSAVVFDNLGSNLLVGSELFDTGSYNNIGSVYTFKNVNFTGYLGQVTGTGIVSYDSVLFATGNITGSLYNKTFFDVFDMQTGYYINNQLTGIQSFKTGNLILNQSYKSSGIIDPLIDSIYLSIKAKNYPDDEAITGKLIISGYDNGDDNNSVIINYITGKK